ncbi:MAG: SDR family NAD(P)-dependent oxidoreductase [Acidobacteriota bacterium]|nr:SDR family NAD(P)-dependent oxidoreductase [Acidobacteriota bacterium]
MSDLEYQALMQRALLKLEAAEAEIESLRREHAEPIAIIGMSCRFPAGASSPESFWKLLVNGTDAVREIPGDRWDANAYYDPDPDAAGKIYCRWGSFLDDIDKFDPQFFGIAPREAALMDPQQRLLLEVSWEAIERAGICATDLAGTRTGVMFGVVNHDYFETATRRSNAIDVHTGSGVGLSMAAGRLSHILGLQGPSLVVDTACSTSLVAVHLACQSLRARESDLALAGGANVILSPLLSIIESRTRMLSPTGRCRTFDAAADGVVRGEGCGVLVLKRLSDALRDRDTILSVIRGTAVNHDGRSAGLTVPNGLSQQAVIRQALQNGHVAPEDVGYVEAHGTGTSLGDPIEVESLGAVYGVDRDEPLLVGSVKTNLGHLEAAAGIAGLIKIVLMLQQKFVPAHLHFETPNPRIEWPRLPIRIPTKPAKWRTNGRKRIAAVSSFGFSGTNAHMVVEEPPPAPPLAREDHGPYLLTLSARTPSALRDLVKAYHDHIAADHDGSLADICFTANTGRAAFSWRAAFSADDAASLCESLRAFREGEFHDDVAPDSARIERGESGRKVLLPTYPFQRQRYWVDDAGDGLLGERVHAAALKNGERLFERELSEHSPAFLAEHRIDDVAIVPATAYLEMALEAFPPGDLTIEQVMFERALELRTPRTVQLLMRGARFEIYSREGESEWILHCSGTLAASHRVSAAVSLGSLLAKRGDEIPVAEHYEQAERGGLSIGPRFRGMEQLWRCDGGGLSRVRQPELVVLEAEGYRIHPAFLDACLQVITVGLAPASDNRVYVPAGIDRLSIHGRPGAVIWSHARLRTSSDERLVFDVSLYSENGEPAGAAEGLVMKRAARGVLTTPSDSLRDALYEPVWIAKPGRENPARYLPPMRELQDRVRSELQSDVPVELLTAYEDALADLESLSVAYIADAIRALGSDRVAQQHARLFDRCLEILTEVGTSPSRDTEREWNAAAARHPAFAPELNMLRRCGTRLADVLRGRADGLQLLFPDANTDEVAKLYSNSALIKSMNAAAQRAVAIALQRRAPGSAFRVLETGAGSGGTTSWLLPQLAAGDCEYHFTDVSPLFLATAKEKFAQYPFVRYATFDVERSALEQGFKRNQFDMVIASNVLHTTRDLRLSLKNLREVLVPGGMFLLLEGTVPLRWVDITFGLTAGWWKFADYDLRPSHPLMNAAAWRALLLESGFAEAEMVSLEEPAVLRQQAVIAARAPMREPRKTEVLIEPDCRRVLEVVQSPASRLCLVTRGAQPAGPDDAVPGLAQSPVWGMARVIAREHPELDCVRIDLDPDVSIEDQRQRVHDELECSDGEDEIAFRGTTRYVPRLRPLGERASRPQPSGVPPDGYVLITGGFGGLGLLVAEWLTNRGARNLVLLGRSAPSKQAIDRIKALRANVVIEHADVADENALRAVLGRLDKPLRGVIHAAGVVDDGVLQRQTWERFARVLAPKVDGAWNLHRLTEHQPLDFFVLFSSAVSLLGATGQANHTAASAFLDALAHARRAKGLPAISINWGGWLGVGAADRPEAEERLSKLGMRAIQPEQGLRVMEVLLATDVPQVGVMPIDWTKFQRNFTTSPFLSEVLSGRTEMHREDRSFFERVEAARPADRDSLLEREIQTHVARVLGFRSAHDVDPRQKLFDLGIDSLLAVELKNRLSNAFGANLRSTLVFDFPTVEALKRHLSREVLLLPHDQPAAEPIAEDVVTDDVVTDDVKRMSEQEILALIDHEYRIFGEGTV